MSRVTPLELIKLSKHKNNTGAASSTALPPGHVSSELSKQYELSQQTLPARSTIPKDALDLFRGPPDHTPLTFGNTANSLASPQAIRTELRENTSTNDIIFRPQAIHSFPSTETTLSALNHTSIATSISSPTIRLSNSESFLTQKHFDELIRASPLPKVLQEQNKSSERKDNDLRPEDNNKEENKNEDKRKKEEERKKKEEEELKKKEEERKKEEELKKQPQCCSCVLTT